MAEKRHVCPTRRCRSEVAQSLCISNSAAFGLGNAKEPQSFWDAKLCATSLHMAEFFDCVRTRKQCSENAEVGHYAAAGHMVNLSYRSGQRMLWDATSGTVKS